MNETEYILAVDGHDGTGKTTLAMWLAKQVDGTYQRPFSGALGAALLNAANRGDVTQVIALGNEGIDTAISAAGDRRPIVLDRCWMTVASLVTWTEFSSAWKCWIPTILCWADLETTVSRLNQRAEEPETVESHRHYLRVYCELAERTDSRILRTDLNSLDECKSILLDWFKTTCNGE